MISVAPAPPCPQPRPVTAAAANGPHSAAGVRRPRPRPTCELQIPHPQLRAGGRRRGELSFSEKFVQDFPFLSIHLGFSSEFSNDTVSSTAHSIFSGASNRFLIWFSFSEIPKSQSRGKAWGCFRETRNLMQFSQKFSKKWAQLFFPELLLAIKSRCF